MKYEGYTTRVQEALETLDLIKCTGCHYCMEGCPVKMDIPNIFIALNKKRLNDPRGARGHFGLATSRGTKPSDCLACGQCEEACPQSLPIISLLEEARETFE